MPALYRELVRRLAAAWHSLFQTAIMRPSYPSVLFHQAGIHVIGNLHRASVRLGLINATSLGQRASEATAAARESLGGNPGSGNALPFIASCSGR